MRPDPPGRSLFDVTDMAAPSWWSWSRIRALDSRIVDPALSAASMTVALVSLLHAEVDADHPTSVDALAWVLTVVVFGSLAVRSRWPLQVLATCLVATVTFTAIEYSEAGLPIGCMIALYTVAALTPRRQSILATAAVAAAIIGLSAIGAQGLDAGGAASNLTTFGMAYALGRYVQIRRAYLSELELRARAQKSERRREAEQAVAEERLRIARELHDVVAHAMSVVAVQSGVAAHVIRRDPAQAEEMLATINGMSREALAEMRRLLGVLRAGSDGCDAELAPAPSLADLPSLLATVEGTGVSADLRVEGQAPLLSPGLDLAAFRVVQEALTNVVRHAGPAHVEVVVRYRIATMELSIEDDGRGAASSAADAPGGGHGITGMRERVELYGGDFASGSRPGGGFAVSATFPYEPPSVPA